MPPRIEPKSAQNSIQSYNPIGGKDTTVSQFSHLHEEIGAKSALPQHLQAQSYDQDIWGRIKSHPLRNPTLFQNKLDEDTESREIIRQVLGAAQQREAEILLYNNSRVFKHLLTHVISSFSSFMSSPLIPGLRPSKEILSNVIEVENTETVAEDHRKLQLPKLRHLRAFLAWFLTPKYILLAIVAFLGIATGQSQLQIYHQRIAIESLEQAIKSSEEARTLMEETIERSLEQQKDTADRISRADLDLAEQKSIVNGVQDELAMKLSSLAESEAKVKNLEERLEQERKEVQLNDSEKDTMIQDLNNQIQNLTGGLAAKTANLESASAELSRLRPIEQEKNILADKLSDERRNLNARLAERNLQIAELATKESVLLDAQACINTIEREVKGKGIKNQKISDALTLYRTQSQLKQTSHQ